MQEDDTPIMWHTRKLIIIVSKNVQIKKRLQQNEIALNYETCAFKHIKWFCNDAEQAEWEPAEIQENLKHF